MPLVELLFVELDLVSNPAQINPVKGVFLALRVAGSCGIRELGADEAWRTGTLGVGGIFLCLVAQRRTRGAGIILNVTQQEHVGLELLGDQDHPLGSGTQGWKFLGKRDHPHGQGWICCCPVSLCARGSLWWLW